MSLPPVVVGYEFQRDFSIPPLGLDVSTGRRRVQELCGFRALTLRDSWSMISHEAGFIPPENRKLSVPNPPGSRVREWPVGSAAAGDARTPFSDGPHPCQYHPLV